MSAKSLLPLTTLLSLLALSFSSQAQWSLDNSESSLSFLSTKKAQITEIHTFEKLSGQVSDAGELTVSVDLTSVATNIPIRDERMQSMLFNTDKFASATFTAALPAGLQNLAVGAQVSNDVTGKLSLHGITADATFSVMASRINETTLLVTTLKPTVINAASFGLADGIEALREIAKLDSITLAVPVSFTATFKQR